MSDDHPFVFDHRWVIIRPRHIPLFERVRVGVCVLLGWSIPVYRHKFQRRKEEDDALFECKASLVEIQYFAGQKHKHRAWAWDALNALDPGLAEMDPKTAFDLFRGDDGE